MTYVLHDDAIETAAGTFIPRDEANADFRAVVAELQAAGVTLNAPDGVLLRTPGPNTLQEWQAHHRAALAAYRFDREVGGVAVGDIAVLTDRDSQAKVHAALFALQQGIIGSVRWKAPTGWVTLDAAAMAAVASAVVLHVQQCFARESAVSDLIAALPDSAAAATFDPAAAWAAVTV